MDLPMPRFLVAALIALALALPAAAQSFAPRIRVDEQVITGYELDQRQRFLAILGVQGDIAREAENSLIDDRLRLAEARRLGLRATPEQIRAGMEEFAGRAQLTADELIDIFAQNGIAEATFRDFVEAGILWRELVRARFVPRLQNVSEADVDRALLLESQRGPTVRVQFSEILLPAGRNAEAARLSRTLRGEAAFAAVARERSLAATAAEGGRVDWTPVAWLPPQVAAALGSVQVGQVTPPVAVAGGVAIYLLRGTQTLPSITPRVTMVEYATVAIPGAGTPQAAAEVARLRAGADRCGDLWGLTQGGADRVRIERRLLSDTPAAIAAELGRLDVGEASARLTSGDSVLFLMLCERRIESGQAPSREAIRERIILERLEGSARIWLAELRARADIRR
jgi:peptidyl-prolyl cis-trans isomerase SurA